MDSSAVFISYSREDLEAAVRLEQALKKEGLTTWRDQESLYAGQQWPKALGEAISSNDYILLLWSKHSADSHFVEFEWTTGIALRKTIVPCLLDDTPLVPALISFNGIPLQEIEEAVPRILNTIRLTKPGGSDSERSSSVLEKLQQVVPDDPEVMARVGTILVNQAVVAESPSPASQAKSMTASQVQTEDMRIGDRYQVIKMLGRGGMGAVYHVYDSELERDAALKVIRSDLADEPTVIQRFKREIQLSSTVTHRNVLRVYDLGESDGIKFLTMQYVEGEELTDVLKREGKLSKDQAVRILRQIALGLAAAHEKGVIHRDLKPANILLDKHDEAFITDFGLATTQAQSGLTQAGDVMGTPHYMSPEQVKGEPADAQADIYSLGVMLYEMTTGELPFTGNTIFEIMMQRTVKDPIPAKQLNPEIPDFLDKIIQGCLARETAARYASIEELLEDLKEGEISGQTIMMTRLKMRNIRRQAGLLTPRRLAMILPVLLLCLIGGWWLVDRVLFEQTDMVAEVGPREPVSVLIADFQNDTDDAVFSGLIEETLGSTLEGASFITTFNRGRARRLAGQLKEGSKVLDESACRLVAQREGISVVVTGSLARSGDAYEIAVRTVDALTGDEIESDTLEVDERDNVLGGLGRLAARIRRKLGDTTPDSAQLAAAETFTATSFEGAKAYAKAQELHGAGDYEEAIGFFREAIELDPNMGRAHAGLAVTLHNLEKREESEAQFQLAMQNIDRMSERERLRTRGQYFLIAGNYPKAIDELSSLVEKFPADYSGHTNLAMTYFKLRDMEKAKLAAAEGTSIYPTNVVMRSNAAFYSMYASDFDTAIKEARALLREDPEYGFNYICLALSELGRGDVSGAEETYRNLKELGGLDATFAVMGLSDLAMYEGRFSDAVDILLEGIEVDRQNDDFGSLRRKSLALAKSYLALGRKEQAFAEADRVLKESDYFPLLYEAALVFVRGGETTKAREIAAGLMESVSDEPRMYGLLIQAEAGHAEGKSSEAIRSFLEAQKITDSWLGRFGLGRAYLSAEAFTEAYSEFEQCLKRQGEATAVFLDDIPSYSYFPPVHFYLGRAQEGLGSPAAKDSYQAFLDIKKNSEADEMVEDARRRVGG